MKNTSKIYADKNRGKLTECGYWTEPMATCRPRRNPDTCV